jgi:hypothetical protein
LGPEGAALSSSVLGVRWADLPAGEGVQWDYILIIENPNRRSATLTRQTLTLAWDSVSLAPQIDQTRRVIPAHGSVWLPKSTVFRRTDFQASSGAPEHSPDPPRRPDGMWISWQLLGQYESGGSFLLNLDFFPDRGRAAPLQGP